MRELSNILLISANSNEDYEAAISQAISFAQKALDVVTEIRQSHKGKFEYDLAYLIALFDLGLSYRVSVFRIKFYLSTMYFFSWRAITTKPMSCWKLL